MNTASLQQSPSTHFSRTTSDRHDHCCQRSFTSFNSRRQNQDTLRGQFINSRFPLKLISAASLTKCLKCMKSPQSSASQRGFGSRTVTASHIYGAVPFARSERRLKRADRNEIQLCLRTATACQLLNLHESGLSSVETQCTLLFSVYQGGVPPKDLTLHALLFNETMDMEAAEGR